MDFGSLQEFLNEIPVWVFLIGLTLLPLVPVPVSLLWVVAGARLGSGIGWVASCGCLFLNLCLAYGICHFGANKMISRLLNKKGFKIPELNEQAEWKIALLFRIFPGLPLVVQNYLLGVSGISLKWFLLFGMGVQMIYCAGFIFIGEALFEGSSGLLVAGCALLLSISIGFRIYCSKRKVNCVG